MLSVTVTLRSADGVDVGVGVGLEGGVGVAVWVGVEVAVGVGVGLEGGVGVAVGVGVEVAVGVGVGLEVGVGVGVEGNSVSVSVALLLAEFGSKTSGGAVTVTVSEMLPCAEVLMVPVAL